MRQAILVSAVVLAAAVASTGSLAQDLPINQRFTAPTAHAETYAGLTLSQLVLALGLSLQGVPHDEMRRDLGRRLDAFEVAGQARHRGSNDAPTPVEVPSAGAPSNP